MLAKRIIPCLDVDRGRVVKGVKFVDIRDAGDYKEGHIPQARHLPFGALQERLGELVKAKDQPVIVYCRTGTTSQSACVLLKKNGFTNVHSLKGGLPSWLDARLPVSRKK